MPSIGGTGGSPEGDEGRGQDTGSDGGYEGAGLVGPDLPSGYQNAPPGSRGEPTSEADWDSYLEQYEDDSPKSVWKEIWDWAKKHPRAVAFMTAVVTNPVVGMFTYAGLKAGTAFENVEADLETNYGYNPSTGKVDDQQALIDDMGGYDRVSNQLNQNFGLNTTPEQLQGSVEQDDFHNLLTKDAPEAPEMTQIKGADSTALEGATAGLKGVSSEEFDAATKTFEGSINDVAFVHDIAELTGGLTDFDREQLETIRSNMTQNFISTLNETTLDAADNYLANLVDKGVLQGTIGERTFAHLFEAAGKQATQFSLSLGSFLAEKGLDISQQNKTHQMELWAREQAGEIAKTGFYKDAAQLALEGERTDVQKWGKLADVELDRYKTDTMAGIEGGKLEEFGKQWRTESTQRWDTAKLDSYTSMYGADRRYESGSDALDYQKKHEKDEFYWDVFKEVSDWDLWG